jgi:hypothetical protein
VTRGALAGRVRLRTPRARLLAAVALIVVSWLGGWLVGGSAGGMVGVRREESAKPSLAVPVPSTTLAPQAASPACLEAATRADGLIELLIAGRRDRAADLLVAYTIASRQCRHDASSEQVP